MMAYVTKVQEEKVEAHDPVRVGKN